jgi:hypothetical protein
MPFATSPDAHAVSAWPGRGSSGAAAGAGAPMGGDSTGGGVTDWALAVAPKTAATPKAIQVTKPTRSKPAQLNTGRIRRNTLSDQPVREIRRAILRPDSPRGAS